MKTEPKESLWNVPKNIIQIYWFLFVMMGFLAFGIYGIPYIENNTEFGKEIVSNIKQAEDVSNKQYDVVRNTNDCFVLKQTVLQLISDGANDKSWFPNGDDQNLRIGKDRFDYLGCKN